MKHADAIGLDRMLDRSGALHARFGHHWQPRRCSSGWCARGRRSAISIVDGSLMAKAEG